MLAQFTSGFRDGLQLINLRLDPCWVLTAESLIAPLCDLCLACWDEVSGPLWSTAA